MSRLPPSIQTPGRQGSELATVRPLALSPTNPLHRLLSIRSNRTFTKGSEDKAAGNAARKVEAALKPIAKLEKARADAMAKRDALEQAWETAFASLKRGAKAAEDDGHRGIHAALFERPAPAKKKARAKKTVEASAPA